MWKLILQKKNQNNKKPKKQSQEQNQKQNQKQTKDFSGVIGLFACSKDSQAWMSVTPGL